MFLFLSCNYLTIDFGRGCGSTCCRLIHCRHHSHIYVIICQSGNPLLNHLRRAQACVLITENHITHAEVRDSISFVYEIERFNFFFRVKCVNEKFLWTKQNGTANEKLCINNRVKERKLKLCLQMSKWIDKFAYFLSCLCPFWIQSMFVFR